jgi:hypothetical protein
LVSRGGDALRIADDGAGGHGVGNSIGPDLRDDAGKPPEGIGIDATGDTTYWPPKPPPYQDASSLLDQPTSKPVSKEP